jgi:hypothetical protein
MRWLGVLVALVGVLLAGYGWGYRSGVVETDARWRSALLRRLQQGSDDVRCYGEADDGDGPEAMVTVLRDAWVQRPAAPEDN